MSTNFKDSWSWYSLSELDSEFINKRSFYEALWNPGKSLLLGFAIICSVLWEKSNFWHTFLCLHFSLTYKTHNTLSIKKWKKLQLITLILQIQCIISQPPENSQTPFSNIKTGIMWKHLWTLKYSSWFVRIFCWRGKENVKCNSNSGVSYRWSTKYVCRLCMNIANNVSTIWVLLEDY